MKFTVKTPQGNHVFTNHTYDIVDGSLLVTRRGTSEKTTFKHGSWDAVLVSEGT